MKNLYATIIYLLISLIIISCSNDSEQKVSITEPHLQSIITVEEGETYIIDEDETFNNIVFNIYGDLHVGKQVTATFISCTFNMYGGSITAANNGNVNFIFAISCSEVNWYDLESCIDLHPKIVEGCLEGYDPSEGCGQPPDLPVELIYFRGEEQGDNILLEWATASEINNKGFHLEKSFDGRNWDNIAFIEGQGNSNVKIEYSYLDPKSNSSIIYYRLLQEDLDGITTTFGPLSFTNENVEITSNVFPNPVYKGEEVTVTCPSDSRFDLTVYNTIGQVVFAGSYYNATNVHVDWSSGLYFFNIKSDGYEKTHEIIVSN